MAEIYIRNIDEGIKARLEAEARKHGLSLNKYVCNILTDYALNPQLKDLEDKYANLVKDLTAIYQNREDQYSEILTANNVLMERLLSIIETNGDD